MKIKVHLPSHFHYLCPKGGVTTKAMQKQYEADSQNEDNTIDRKILQELETNKTLNWWSDFAH